MTVVVLTRDLMDGSRFRTALPDVVVVRSLIAAEAAGASLILFDLALGLDPADVAALGPPVVAYGAHVDRAALDAAVAAGCVDAVPRSKVFRRAADFSP